MPNLSVSRAPLFVAVAGFVFAFGGAPVVNPAFAADDCEGWDAIYRSAPDFDGVRVTARFGPPTDAVGRVPFLLEATAKDGSKAWSHAGFSWCYQGSGGCYVGLTYGKKADTDDEAKNRLRLVFAYASSFEKRQGAPDLMIVAGLNSTFHYNQGHRAGDGEGIVLDGLKSEATAYAPEVFYFEKCEFRK